MVHFKSSIFVAASALLSVSSAAAATQGDFDIITINVAGLPALLNGNDIPGDKTVNSKLIGSYLAKYDYDIVHMQEDFNFHAAVYETDDHPYRTSTSGGVPFGSGLNTVANFPWTDYVRTKWNTCNLNSGDCLTPKGFTFMRMQISEGVSIDVYNLHTDAGSETADKVARAANLKQVADYITLRSIGNAVLVFGDTNSRYTREGDGITIFSTQNGLTDAWVQLIRGGVVPTVETLCSNPSTTTYCETVDKAFYRGSKALTLQATTWAYDSTKFLQADGSILTDHNPVRVNLTWAAGSAFRTSDSWGGPHGTWFNDLATIPAAPKLASITFRGGERLDAVSATLRSGQTYTHGGTGGTAVTLTLATNEYWTAATVCSALKDNRTRVFYISATTSTGRTLTAGVKTTSCKDSVAVAGWGIVGFFGQGDSWVDMLGFVYAKM